MTDEFIEITLTKAQAMINELKEKHGITFTEIAKGLNVSPMVISYLRQKDHWHQIGKRVIRIFADLVNHVIEFRGKKFIEVKSGKTIGKEVKFDAEGKLESPTDKHIAREVLSPRTDSDDPIILNRVIENMDFWDIIRMAAEQLPKNTQINITICNHEKTS